MTSTNDCDAKVVSRMNITGVELQAALMASLNQDNCFGFSFSGKVSSMSNVQHRELKLLVKKTDGSMKRRRRPLQELSCKNLENLGSSKALDMTAKPNQDKVKNNGGRRALGDLTNSSKLLERGVKKSSSLKRPSVAKEGCLHDHGECTKAQRYAAMDMDCFLETVGLRKDEDLHSVICYCSTPIVCPKFPQSTTSKSKLESPARLEFDFYGTLSPTASPKLESPVRHLDQDVHKLQLEWDALDFCCGFKMDSPSK